MAGLGPARLRLAHLYAAGRGVGRDRVRALMWLEMAGGAAGTDSFRRSLTEAMPPGEIAEARRPAAAGPAPTAAT